MHKFDKDIVITQESNNTFKAKITDDWSINGNPNGGYLIALIAIAMVQCTEKRSNPILTANFMSRSRPGDAEIHVERISQSNHFDRFEAKLIQEGKERARAIHKIRVCSKKWDTAATTLCRGHTCRRSAVAWTSGVCTSSHVGLRGRRTTTSDRRGTGSG